MRKNKKLTAEVGDESLDTAKSKQFHLKFLTEEQRNAWEVFQQSTILFMIGAAGTGKSFLAVAFALQQILEKSKDKIYLSRPVVESGESLGFLPGDISEKIYPYMLPLYDALDKMCGRNSEEKRKYINSKVELAPLAYLRGRSLENSVCVLDEAQNCTAAQLKLFLTRLSTNSRMIITGDPSQSDLKNCEFLNIIDKIKHIDGIGVINFTEEAIVRHPIIKEIVKCI